MFQGDVRRYIALSTFGFFDGGTLDVNLYNFRVDDGREGELVITKIAFGKTSFRPFILYFYDVFSLV